jgi:glycosyltransferase involved in cell wall biosynthesis
MRHGKRIILSIFFIFFSCHSFSFQAGEIQKTIGIFAYQDVRVSPWDPDSIHSGVVGSEEAVIYLSQKLAHLGYKVTVFAHPPPNSRHSHPEANPRYVAEHFDRVSRFDIAIAWRMPWKGEELKKRAQKVYLWPHDTSQGVMTHAQIHAFDDVLWLSQWQRENWIESNLELTKFNQIFGNGINVEQFHPIQERKNPYACIYGSNYARGLEILLDIWPQVKHKFPLATLDIYYGWQHWGLLSPEKELKMRNQIAKLALLGVREHGLVSHEQLNRAYEQASLWTYPCILPETFCITALRAQLAGALPVIIEGSALKETVRSGYKCHEEIDYLPTLLKAMQTVENIKLEDRKKIGEFILKEFTWEAIAQKWKQLFESSSSPETEAVENKTVLVAILARNKAHVLDRFLKCIDNLDYNKKLMTVYIKTENNVDQTKEILQEWMVKHGTDYHSIIFDTNPIVDIDPSKPHEWSPNRFKVLGAIRDKSLRKAKECQCDYYFVVDCDNFIAPSTLKDLVKKDKPIIAPLLRSIPEPHDLYANFFYVTDERGYYKDHPSYYQILNRTSLGTFKVDLVHCTYLIKSEYFDKLSYLDETEDYEFIIFSRSARKHQVDQYICNEKEYGVQIHYYDNLSLQEEKERVLPILTLP